MPVDVGQPCEPALHVFCMRLAYGLVGIVEPVLRPDEVNLAAQEFYAAIRRDLEEYQAANRERGAS
jgi:hypothetical protein